MYRKLKQPMTMPGPKPRDNAIKDASSAGVRRFVGINSKLLIQREGV